MTNPQSMLQSFISPCEAFQGWKGVSLGGKKASRSYGDLKIFRGFEWNVAPVKKVSLAGQAAFEKLPVEILSAIIDNLHSDIPPGGFKPRNGDLVAMLLTSKALHTATLSSLYKNITIPHSKVFRKFLAHITKYPSLGTIVRRLDFSHFNPTGAGMSAGERASTNNLTKETLLQCLDLLPNLQEFLGQEHIDEDISAATLRKLLSMHRLRALDFCGFSSTSFLDAFKGLFHTTQVLDIPATLPLARLSLHECTTIPASVFSTLLPRLPALTHLDVAHTRITYSALSSIPPTAKLTHLNLSRCGHITGPEVVQFLTTHPAARTLTYLNLMTDAKSHELLSAIDITALLPHLPKSLKSLNLKGAKMSHTHIPLLTPLTHHLEELGLGRTLSYANIITLLLPPSPSLLPPTATGPDFARTSDLHDAWTAPSLKYVDLSDLDACDVDMGLFFSKGGSLLRNSDLDLDVVELSESMAHAMGQRAGVSKSFGWVVKGEGRRNWLVRERRIKEEKGPLIYRGLKARKWGGELQDEELDAQLQQKQCMDDGARAWKMGATYWGMRKIPVADMEVGGMYGLYMFKR